MRIADMTDLDAVAAIYDEIHQAEEDGRMSIGWSRGVYPVRATAQDAINRGDLYVQEKDGEIVGAAIINQIQVDVYYGAPWKHAVSDDQVCVLHTLVISPRQAGCGLGKEFVRFYEEYAISHGCPELRIDTNAKNRVARAMYRALGYEEIGIVPTVFNGIPGVDLVLLEKWVRESIFHDQTNCKRCIFPRTEIRGGDETGSFRGAGSRGYPAGQPGALCRHGGEYDRREEAGHHRQCGTHECCDVQPGHREKGYALRGGIKE